LHTASGFPVLLRGQIHTQTGAARQCRHSDSRLVHGQATARAAAATGSWHGSSHDTTPGSEAAGTDTNQDAAAQVKIKKARLNHRQYHSFLLSAGVSD